MLLVPIKCRLCGKILSPPDAATIIGESPQVQNQKVIARIMAHIGGKAQEEAKSGGPHSQALLQATMASQNLHAALLIGCFDITAEMEKDRQGVFLRIHALTRTVRMSDAELEEIADSIANESDNACLAVLRNIRDRYESANANAPAAQEVKP